MRYKAQLASQAETWRRESRDLPRQPIPWTAYALWVLRSRRVLLARHRIVAGRMAVAFCAVFFCGALTAVAQTRSTRYGHGWTSC